MTTRKTNMKRSATDRLSQLIKAKLASQAITTEEAARQARLPSNAFRSVLSKKHRPTIDRADELCRALGISMTIGIEQPAADSNDDG